MAPKKYDDLIKFEDLYDWLEEEEEDEDLEESGTPGDEDPEDLLDDDQDIDSEPEDDLEELELPNAGIVHDVFAKSRKQPITFSLVDVDLTSATVEWTIYDKWLGDDEEAYVPTLSTGVEGPDLIEYFDRKLNHIGPSFTTNLYYPGDILVKAVITKETSSNVLYYIYRAQVSRKKMISPSKMRVKYKTVRCAPVLTTHKIAAFYTGNLDFIASQLIIAEADNKISKIVWGTDDEPIITKHTW